MPNWCSNILTLKHEDPNMLKKFKKAFLEEKVCQTFLPEPNWREIILNEKIKELKKSLNKIGREASSKLIEDLNIEAVKVTDSDLTQDLRWYEWRVANWGTKWDFGNVRGQMPIKKNEAECIFDTAWSPPLGLYKKLHKLGFDIKGLYSEPGAAFAGIWENGEDNCYEGSSAADFPDELVEAFKLKEEYEKAE